MIQKGRGARSHCIRGGHLLTVESTIVRKNGTRICRICRRSALAAYAEAERTGAPIASLRAIGSVPREIRFWPKVNKDGPIHPKLKTRCWVWTAGVSRFGYGELAIGGGKKIRAHRFAWVLSHGPVPNGLFVLHRCDNPPCVNPEHLWLGTRVDNIADMVAKGRGSSGYRNATCCKRGHPFAPPHLQIMSNGYRRCRTCATEQQRLRRERVS